MPRFGWVKKEIRIGGKSRKGWVKPEVATLKIEVATNETPAVQESQQIVATSSTFYENKNFSNTNNEQNSQPKTPPENCLKDEEVATTVEVKPETPTQQSSQPAATTSVTTSPDSVATSKETIKFQVGDKVSFQHASLTSGWYRGEVAEVVTDQGYFICYMVKKSVCASNGSWEYQLYKVSNDEWLKKFTP